ncbi:MAG: lipid-A-disaccharide synthase [Pseudomonadota bacterium]
MTEADHRQPRVYMVAAEPSGDVLAREVAEAIRARRPDVLIAGIGGSELAKIGIPSPIDIAPLSVLGLFEGLKAYGTVVKLADEAADAIVTWKPDTVVLVDSWGFMLRVAQRVRARAPNVRLVKLVGPQVWATRAGRAKTLAATVDQLICIHRMEVPYYEPYGLPTTVMGNPALSRTKIGDGAGFRELMNLSADDEVLLVLPGSRRSEIDRVAPVLVEAARLIVRDRPQTKVVFSPALSVRQLFLERFAELDDWALVSPATAAGEDVMRAANLALACSGTVTSELAVQGTPFVVGYKTGWITWALARYLLYKPKHITLLNIAADDTQVAPEYVQTKFTPETLADTALRLLSDPDRRAAQIAAQNEALARMGEGDGNASEIAADAILAGLSAS